MGEGATRGKKLAEERWGHVPAWHAHSILSYILMTVRQTPWEVRGPIQPVRQTPREVRRLRRTVMHAREGNWRGE